MVSRGARNLLRRIVEDGDGEITMFQPGGWWVDTHRTSGRLAFELLRFCLIKRESSGNGLMDAQEVQYFYTTDEAKRVLADESYVPEIVRILRERTTEKEGERT